MLRRTYADVMATIFDLTAEFKSSVVDWHLRRKAFAGQFSQQIQRIRVGLYSAVHVNDSEHPIYDRNRQGRIVVPAWSRSHKSGKFENGLSERFLVNHRHCHRRPPGGAEESDIYREVLHFLLVLDLTDVKLGGPNPAAVFEGYWNQSIDMFLRRTALISSVSPRRGETRFLTRAIGSNRLLPMLDEIGNRILSVEEDLRVPE